VSEANYRQSARLKKPNARALPETAAASVRLSEKKEPEIMKLQLKALSIALGAATLMCGSVWANTTSSVSSGATVTTAADLKIKIIVPKVVILRVGSTGGSAATVDEIEFTATAGGLSGTSVTYTGPIPPVFSNVTVTGATPSAVPVAVWTNAGSATLSCSASTLTGPTGSGAATLGDITVIATTPMPHPGANLGACTTGASLPVPIATGLVDTWQYGLNGSVYAAGTYTTTATYTATAP
jgi:hypothetical protein